MNDSAAHNLLGLTLNSGWKVIEKITKTANSNRNKELNWTAILNYAREEIIAKTDHIETLMKFVSQIPESETDDISIK